MKKILILTTLFVFSFTQVKAICMSDDDLLDYSVVSYIETTWATIEACVEKIPNFDSSIYEKFITQYKPILEASNTDNDYWFKENYGSEWKQQKKENLKLIRSDSSASSVSIIKLKSMCEELNTTSQKYIDNSPQIFLKDLESKMVKEVRSSIPRCESSNSSQSPLWEQVDKLVCKPIIQTECTNNERCKNVTFEEDLAIMLSEFDFKKNKNYEYFLYNETGKTTDVLRTYDFISKNFQKRKKNNHNVVVVNPDYPVLYLFNKTNQGWDALKVVGAFLNSRDGMTASHHTKYICSDK